MLNLTKNLLTLLLSLSLTASFSGYQKCPDKSNCISQDPCPAKNTCTESSCEKDECGNATTCNDGTCQTQKENDPAQSAEPNAESESQIAVTENQEPAQPSPVEQEISCPAGADCIKNDCETANCGDVTSCETPSCQAEKETVTLPHAVLKDNSKAKTTQLSNLFSWLYARTPKQSEKAESVTQNTQNTSNDPIDQTENEILRLVNLEREKAGLKPLRYCTEAQAAADKRALEIKSVFSHTRPDGRSCFTVFDDFGIKDCYMCAENIACGYASAQAVMDAWMNSPGHKANILSTNATALAVGINGNCYVQTFAHDYQAK